MTSLTHTNSAVNPPTNIKNRRFAMIREDVVNSAAWARLTGAAIRVYIAIAMHADFEGRAWPSRERLQIMTKLNIRTVRRAIDELVQAGLMLKHTACGHQPNTYNLIDDPQGVDSPPRGGLALQGEGVCASDQQGSTDPPNRPRERNRRTDQRTDHEETEPSLRKISSDSSCSDSQEREKAYMRYLARLLPHFAPRATSQHHADVTCAKDWWEHVIWPNGDPAGPSRCAKVMELMRQAGSRTNPMAWLTDMVKRLDRGELR